jgi:hypothetical protein
MKSCQRGKPTLTVGENTCFIMSKKSTPPPKYRDAETGHYVPKEYADKHPKTTVKETSKPNKK